MPPAAGRRAGGKCTGCTGQRQRASRCRPDL